MNEQKMTAEELLRDRAQMALDVSNYHLMAYPEGTLVRTIMCVAKEHAAAIVAEVTKEYGSRAQGAERERDEAWAEVERLLALLKAADGGEVTP